MRHYLKIKLLGIFAPQDEPQLTRVDAHMKNGMEKSMTDSARRTSATPSLVARAVRASLCACALALAGGHALASPPNADRATRVYSRTGALPPSPAQRAPNTAPSRALNA